MKTIEKPVLFSIGFTQKTAQQFFNALQKAEVKKIIDIRLNNASQLAGFTKKNDLEFFLKEICRCDYEHRTDWAPTQEILDGFKKKSIDWKGYENFYLELIKNRRVESGVTINGLDHACLLCSEAKPDKCHRRLLAEYLKLHFPQLRIVHL